MGRICPTCGKEFEPKPHERWYRAQVFCNNECRMDYRKKKIDMCVSKYVARKHIIVVDRRVSFVVHSNKEKNDSE